MQDDNLVLSVKLLGQIDNTVALKSVNCLAVNYSNQQLDVVTVTGQPAAGGQVWKSEICHYQLSNENEFNLRRSQELEILQTPFVDLFLQGDGRDYLTGHLLSFSQLCCFPLIEEDNNDDEALIGDGKLSVSTIY